jgi:acyl CoA:acetate/3-ketoacid CoA transferase beta subunit
MVQRSRQSNVASKGVRIKFRREECALGMGQKSNYAAVKDVQINPSEEECASSTGQNTNVAVVKDAQIKLRREECALGMGLYRQRNDAAAKDARIKLRREECALSMGQRRIANDAAVMDVQIKRGGKKECAGSMHGTLIHHNQRTSTASEAKDLPEAEEMVSVEIVQIIIMRRSKPACWDDKYIQSSGKRYEML